MIILIMAGEIVKKFYNIMPESVKTILCLTPFWIRHGKEYRNTRNMLKATQWFPGDQLLQIQLSRLKNVLVCAYSKVPFYRERFDAISFDPFTFNNFNDIKRIPLLNREEVFAHYPRLIDTHYSVLNSYVGNTGGTTGQPLKLLFSGQSDSREWAFMHMQWGRVGFEPGHRRVSFLGVPFRGDKSAAWKYSPMHNELQISPLELSRDQLAGYVVLVKRFKPRFFYGLPSALAVFAAFLLENDIKMTDIRAVLCGSEGMGDEQRALLERGFNARVYSWYGQTEKVVLGGECEQSYQYHLFPEYGYTELIDDDGNQINQPGIIGEIVGTGFINMAMPLIRYRTGDFGQYAGGSCACKRQYPRLEKVLGRRTADHIVTYDNERIPFNAIDTQKGAFINVQLCQFIQKNPGAVDVYVMRNDRFSQADMPVIERELNAQSPGKISFSAFLVDDLIRTDVGKVRNFIQEIRL
jgi:phenylacetate-CoA ligase